MAADVEPLLLTRYHSLVVDFMRSHAPPASWLSGKMVGYHMGWLDANARPQLTKSGKHIRPSLCLWACAACGETARAALPAAAAVEWFHNSTLVHDDIADGDRLRRGRETVWTVWGVPQAINAGDALLALAFLAASGQSEDPARAVRAVSAISTAALEVIEGQCRDLQLEGNATAGPRAYLRMAAAKTGALLGASLQAGALMSGAPATTVARFRHAGRLLGTAFQMRDDWLGMYGDPELTGKSRTADASRYKMTFPVVAAMQVMSPLQQRRLAELFRMRDGDPEPKVRELLEDVDAKTLARDAALRYAAKAVQTIARTRIASDAIGEFEEVAYYVATRPR